MHRHFALGTYKYLFLAVKCLVYGFYKGSGFSRAFRTRIRALRPCPHPLPACTPCGVIALVVEVCNDGRGMKVV